ncbi:MAG: hypothetical protein JWP74_2159 [Marmoricola sp.]|nr:hypothetical protein [Marmoricola sp.]
MALVIVLAVVAFGIVGLVGYLGYQQAKKRREAFAAAAASRGWTYTRSDPGYIDMFDGAPFGTGHSRSAENVLSGTHDGRAFVAFDYEYATTERYTDSEGNSRTRTERHTFSVVALALGHVVPALSVSPEGFFSRVVGRILDNDIDLESEQFNRAFKVSSPDRKFATDVLHPLMMEYLLTMPDLAWSFRQSYLVTIGDAPHSLAGLDATLAAIDGIVDRVPPFAWDR